MHKRFLAPSLLLLFSPLALGLSPDPPPAGDGRDPEPRLERKTPSSRDPRFVDKKDSQGNRYKVDQDGNIYTSGVPNPKRQPASAENVGYYYNHAVDLMNKGYVAQALEVYREILALPAKDERAAEAQKLTRLNYDEIRNFNLKNQELDIEDLVFVVRHVEDGRVIYDNERYRFRVRYPVNWTLENEVRSDDEAGFANLSLKPLAIPGPGGTKVYMGIGVHATRLREGTKLEQFRRDWTSRLEQQVSGLRRRSLQGGSGRLRDHFEFADEKADGRRFAGEDVFIVKAEHGYYLTFTATPETYDPARDIFDRFLSDFEVLP